MVFQILMIFCLPRYATVAFVLLTNSCAFTLLYFVHSCIGTLKIKGKLAYLVPHLVSPCECMQHKQNFLGLAPKCHAQTKCLKHPVRSVAATARGRLRRQPHPALRYMHFCVVQACSGQLRHYGCAHWVMHAWGFTNS